MKNKAIFLDRDGVINIDVGYAHKIKDLKFEEGSVGALKLLQDSNYKLIIITGQSGIGRGYYTEEDYHAFMNEMYLRLNKEGILFDGEYFCPHHPEKGTGEYKINCNCRKPKTGMLEQAAEDFNLDFTNSWVIGDKTDDIEMGKRVNCKTILVKTGKGGKDGHFNVTPDFIAFNLLEATNYILSNNNK